MSPPASGTTSLPQATGLAHDFKPLFGPIAQGGEPKPDRLIARAKRKFLRTFPDGFRDETYLDWERNYKWNAHLR